MHGVGPQTYACRVIRAADSSANIDILGCFQLIAGITFLW